MEVLIDVKATVISTTLINNRKHSILLKLVYLALKRLEFITFIELANGNCLKVFNEVPNLH